MAHVFLGRGAADTTASQRRGGATHQRPRRDQPRRLEVATAALVLLFASASGRILGPPAVFESTQLEQSLTNANEQLQRWSQARAAQWEQLVSKLRRSSAADSTRQPEFAGSWRTDRTVDLDDFLDRAMGVGYLKRTIASKASQTQRLYQRGDVRRPYPHETTPRRPTSRDGARLLFHFLEPLASHASLAPRSAQVVHLEISDRRGTARYTLRPDGRVHSGSGFMKLPIKQKAKWARDGTLMVEERYATHLVSSPARRKRRSMRGVCASSSLPVRFPSSLCRAARSTVRSARATAVLSSDRAGL